MRRWNRNLRYAALGVVLVGAIAVAFNSWEQHLKKEIYSEIKSQEKEIEIVVEVEDVLTIEFDIGAVRYGICNVPCYEEETEEEVDTSYLGYYTLTAYEWTGNPCANGNYPTCGYTAACNSLPLGTRVYIEGYGEYVIEDRGGMSDNVIDIYMGDVDTCIQFGVQGSDVYVIE